MKRTARDEIDRLLLGVEFNEIDVANEDRRSDPDWRNIAMGFLAICQHGDDRALVKTVIERWGLLDSLYEFTKLPRQNDTLTPESSSS